MFTDMELLQLKNAVSRILHVPGNDTGGVLEMAIVADYNLPVSALCEGCRQIAAMLKKQNETFRNVRLNLIRWISDGQIEKEVIPLSFLLTGRAFADEADVKKPENGTTDAESREKTLDELFRQLKLFYARSKVILVLTDGSYRTEDKNMVKAYLQPFLAKKLLLLQNGEQISGIKLFMA